MTPPHPPGPAAPSSPAWSPLTADELEERLDETLFSVLSSRRTAAAIAGRLSRLPREQQEFVLRWTKVAAQLHGEVGYQFAAHAHEALAVLDEVGVEKWLLGALDLYDGQGSFAAIAALRDVPGHLARLDAGASAVALPQVADALALFVQGLSGRALAIEPADEPWTDTETIFLPRVVRRFESRERNRTLLKAIAAHLWAQVRFGTFNTDVEWTLRSVPHPRRMLAWFNLVEALRLEARLAEHLPGLARDMAHLRGELPQALRAPLRRLARPTASAGDSLALARELARSEPPPPFCYLGALHPDRAAPVRAARLSRERALLALSLERLAGQRPPPLGSAEPTRWEARVDPATLDFELRFDGEAIAPPEDTVRLGRSIIQDLGALPPDYLVPAGHGGYDPEARPERQAPAEAPAPGGRSERDARRYDEWDHRRRDYRKGWCFLYETDSRLGDPRFVDAARRKHRQRITQVRRRFEALRGEDRMLRRQREGEEVDYDAVVEAWADRAGGIEPSDRLFATRRRVERSIAVLFMVDMSGSTKGWINECEREALVMLCEALESLGDRYAIYGFSGWSRKRCEVYRIKRFDEGYDEPVRARIAGVEPKDYTRMGAAIRHLSATLLGVEARTRLLVTLSDGKPDDFHDEYRGEYGIEDTRRALIEARRAGIHPFCITIDETGRDYLPRLYGPARYVVIDDVARLPYEVAEVYRRLTS